MRTTITSHGGFDEGFESERKKKEEKD